MSDLNYLTDARNQPAASRVLYLEREDGSTDEIELPTTWAVCSVCNGEGKHVNPSIDCGGLTADDFHDDPDFESDYFGGVYDVTCNRCNGRTTERVVDWNALTDEQREAYENQLEGEASDRAEHLAEIRAGC